MANEKRPIDANKIPYHQSGFPKGDGFDSDLDWAFREDINKLPTVDAVEVVRCKDCRHYRHFKGCGNWCHRRLRSDIEFKVKPSDFCSYGERRADA